MHAGGLPAGEVEEKLTPEEGEASAKDEVSKVQKKAKEKELVSEASGDDENAAPGLNTTNEQIDETVNFNENAV